MNSAFGQCCGAEEEADGGQSGSFTWQAGEERTISLMSFSMVNRHQKNAKQCQYHQWACGDEKRSRVHAEGLVDALELAFSSIDSTQFHQFSI